MERITEDIHKLFSVYWVDVPEEFQSYLRGRIGTDNFHLRLIRII